ncbi:hypothetical protein TSO5_13960 [Azospirillum sp. TSO5]|nr:hypothetical protein TSO5_13960 [Azospirillum sp. TSO5]
MMKHVNHERLRQLRLYGMAKGLEALERLPDRGQLAFDEQLGTLTGCCTDGADAVGHGSASVQVLGRALQSERCPPSPHHTAEAARDQLGRL